MKLMHEEDDNFNSRTNESLAQIEQTMKSMISMAKNGHFPFLISAHPETSDIFSTIHTLSLISPHKSKKILYQSLVKCRRHQCFKRKMKIIQNFEFEDKAVLVKALITLATDSNVDEGLVIH